MTLVSTSLLLLATGALVAVSLYRVPRVALTLSMAAMTAGSIAALIAAFQVLGGDRGDTITELTWTLPFGAAHMQLDRLSAWFLLTVAMVSAVVAPYSVAYMRPFVGREPVPIFAAILCVLVASLILVVCAADTILFLIGWESMSLAAFFLVSFHHDRAEVRRGAWMYLIATHVATALFVLPLFAALYANAGSTAFSAFPAAMRSASPLLLCALFALAVLGFGTKAGFFPMHVWLPAAHPVAPTPVSALLSGVVVKTGIYGLLRCLTWLPPLPAVCGQVLLLIGIVSGVLGVLYALAQHDLKRLLAYHTVENIGIIAIGIAVGMLGQSANQPAVAALGYAGALLHVTNHALFKGLLFLSAGATLHSTGTVELERLGGLAKRTPVNAAMFLTGAVAICALPPLNGFVSEWVVYGGLFRTAILGANPTAGFAALAVLGLALMGGLALACFAKVYGIVFLGEARDTALPSHATPMLMKLSMTVLAALCVAIGLFPALWLPLARPAAGLLAAIPAQDVAPAMEGIVAAASGISRATSILVIIATALMVVRALALRRTTRQYRDVQPIPTWGCGYAVPTPRMQYTAASFAASLVSSFRAALWPHRAFIAPAGQFPGRSILETHTPDLAEKELFRPVYRGVTRAVAMARTISISGRAPMPTRDASVLHGVGPVKTAALALVAAFRRGSIQVYLLFIVLTLLTLFIVEGIATARATLRADSNTGIATEAGREQ